MTIKIEYNKIINSHVFSEEVPAECKPYMDSAWFNNTNQKYTVFWIDPVPQNIMDSFQSAIDNHDSTKFHSSHYKLYRYTDMGFDETKAPKQIDFTIMLDIGLAKGNVTFDYKGSPMEVKYFHEGEEICKRVWTFKFFTKDQIMTDLGVNEAIANAMADDLVWSKGEFFHWMKEDGTYPMDHKVKTRNFVPFDQNGIPDLVSFYVARKEERERGRKVIMELLEIEVVKFIMDGGALALEAARTIGRDFLRTYTVEFGEYITAGDSTIEASIANDVTFAFLDYDSAIALVDVRKWIINRLRQIQDLTTAL